MQFQDWQVTDRISRIRRAYNRQGIRVTIHPHYLEIPFGLIGVGGQVQTIGVTPMDADFAWIGAMRYPEPELGADAASMADPLWGFSLRITLDPPSRAIGRHVPVAGSGDRSWCPLNAIAGTGRRPALWAYPILCPGSSRIIVDARNDTDHEATVFLTLLGAKFYHHGTQAGKAA